MIALLALLNTAAAQNPTLPDIDAQTYRMPTDARRTQWTDEAHIGPMGHYNLSLLTHYTRGALGSYNESDGLTHYGLKDAFGLNLIGAVHLKHVRIGLDVPFYALTTSDFEVGGGGIGDVSIDVKVSPTPGIAVAARVSLPSSSLDTPLGSPGVTYEITAIVSRDVGEDTTLAGNIGFRGLPTGLLGNQLVARLGAGHMVQPNVGISLDLALRVDLGTGFSANQSPLEALAGAWTRLDNGLVLRGGLGTGLSNGVGSALFRGLFSIGYQPSMARDRDNDGFPDSADACPYDAEDDDGFEPDGCPDPDNDGDGILDVDDTCPDEPEDFDTYLDDDGCIDALTLVHFQVLTADGRSVATANSTVEGTEEPIAGPGDFTQALLPGTYTFSASAEGFDDGSTEVTVTAGAPMSAHVNIKAKVLMAAAMIEVTDTNGHKLDATWAWSGAPATSINGGEGAVTMLPGEYTVIVSATDHDSEQIEVTLADKESKQLKVQLVPHVGTLALWVVDEERQPIPGATWQYGDQEAQLLGAGSTTQVELGVGDYPMLLAAPGFKGATALGKVTGGETTELVITLKALKVTITEQKIDIADKVYFASGSPEIKPESYELLDDVAKIIIDHPKLKKVRIEGHTDSRGSEANNLKLSIGRAASVLEYMVAAGVERERLESEGFGESKPIDPADTPEALRNNRRVEFYIVGAE